MRGTCFWGHSFRSHTSSHTLVARELDCGVCERHPTVWVGALVLGSTSGYRHIGTCLVFVQG